MQQVLVAVLLILPSVQAVVVRGAVEGKLRGKKSNCPGLKAPCSGNGECAETTGICWCKIGWGSTDCSDEMADTYDIKSVNSQDMEDMIGRYTRVPMYIQENAGDPQNMKFIHYDPISSGWSISKLNSSCTDDMCFFAYAKGQPVPPPKGYVFGQPDKHVYYKQLIFDDKELYPGREAGYHMSVSYSPDPNAVGITESLAEFTGRYILQPRYVHERSGKYAIMPVSLNSPGKAWSLLGLTGVGPARKWQTLAQTTDPSLNRYMIPAEGWSPPNMGFKIVPSCSDHVQMETCNSLEDQCRGNSADTKWVQACCRDTCNSCAISASNCKLPQTQGGAQALLQMFNRTLQK